MDNFNKLKTKLLEADNLDYVRDLDEVLRLKIEIEQALERITMNEEALTDGSLAFLSFEVLDLKLEELIGARDCSISILRKASFESIRTAAEKLISEHESGKIK